MAHPRRTAEAMELAKQFSALSMRVVYDPDPTGPSSTIRTAKQAWRPWLADATHHLVIQDDVILHPHFEEQVSMATSRQPEAILSFFSEWGSFTSHALRVAALSGYSWVTQPDTYLGTQAVLMPADAAAQFAVELGDIDETVPDDHAIHAFAYRCQLRHYVSNPNLVEHELGASLTGNGAQGARRATVFLPQTIADQSWWSRPPLTGLTAIPAMHWSTATPSTYVRAQGPGAQWSLEAPRPLWGGVEDIIRSDIQELVVRVVNDRESDIAHALSAVALVLANQRALAAALPLPEPHDLTGITASKAVSTLVPGCLRKLIIRDEASLDTDVVQSELTGLLQVCDELLPQLNLRRLRETSYDDDDAVRHWLRCRTPHAY